MPRTAGRHAADRSTPAAADAPPSERSTVRRLPERAAYDRATIDAILDEGLVAHVGITDAEGRPVVIPMAYGRAGDRLYLHGLPASRLLRALASGADVCVTVTHLDGLVLARSTFHHSIKYRTVVIFGKGRLVRDRRTKLEALRVITEHLVPGRSADARGPSERELKGTWVVEIALAECAAKIRSGGPKDDPDDADLPVWTGVVPLSLTAGTGSCKRPPGARLCQPLPPPGSGPQARLTVATRAADRRRERPAGPADRRCRTG